MDKSKICELSWRRMAVCSECKADRPHSKVRLGNSRKVIPGHVESISGDEIADGFQKAYDSVVSRWGYSDLIWLACTDGKINSRAIEGGRTSSGEHMYVARAVSPGWTKCLGCFIPSQRACFIPWNGTVVMCKDYELLCRRERRTNKAFRTPTASKHLGDSLKILAIKNPWKPEYYVT